MDDIRETIKILENTKLIPRTRTIYEKIKHSNLWYWIVIWLSFSFVIFCFLLII